MQKLPAPQSFFLETRIDSMHRRVPIRVGTVSYMSNQLIRTVVPRSCIYHGLGSVNGRGLHMTAFGRQSTSSSKVYPCNC
jgi:hypothetical protein